MYTINTENAALSLKGRAAELTTYEELLELDRYSDGSELIPAEVWANRYRLENVSLASGYTVDEEGLINAYSVEPVMYVDATERAGFTVYAEKLNGRLAMIGFVSLLVLEVLTGHGLLWWLTNA